MITSADNLDASPLVEAGHVAKRFKIYPRPTARLAEWASLGSLKRHHDFWALCDISFSVRRGECLGIIGPNGSGKSTLLKILTGVLSPSSGTFSVRGRLLSLLELGAGINPELTGRQNVHNSAQLLAFPPGYAEKTMPEIEAFAELGEFFDRPMRMYSSGMAVRLSFSMFACFCPEVFVVDEALSVGDIHFQQKCVARIEEMRAAGTTFLFVSHDMAAIRRLCTHALLLNQGNTVFLGPPEEAVSRYYAVCGETGGIGQRAPRPGDVSRSSTSVPPPAAESRQEIFDHDLLRAARSRHGVRGIELLAATIKNSSGDHQLTAHVGDSIVIAILLKAHAPISEPSAGLHLYDRLANLVFAAGTRQISQPLAPLEAGEERIVRFKLTLNIAPGEYTLALGASEPSTEGPDLGIVHDRFEGVGPINVVSNDRQQSFYGIARLPLEVL